MSKDSLSIVFVSLFQALSVHAPLLLLQGDLSWAHLGQMFGPGTIFQGFAAKLPFHVIHFFKVKHEMVLVRARPDWKCQELVHCRCTKEKELRKFLTESGFLTSINNLSERSGDGAPETILCSSQPQSSLHGLGMCVCVCVCVCVYTCMYAFNSFLIILE